MSNVLELTNLLGSKNRYERISGRLASKLRLTEATDKSLRGNINKNLIVKGVEKWNNAYSELRNAVVTAEVAAAEQEARDSVLKNSTDAKEEEKRKALIAEDNLVADITSYEVVKDRLDDLKVETRKLEKKFGTLGKNFGVNVKEKFSSKALSVPQFYTKVYRQILMKSDLYKMADKIGFDPSIEKTDELNEKVANWRGLFDGIDNSKTEDVPVVTDDNRVEEEYVPVESRGVSEEELSQRRLIGQLGEELKEVRRLQVSTNGLASPFSAGLNEREESLLSMLSNLSGVENLSKRKVIATVDAPNTEFQNFIEQVVGYKKPITEEEHLEKEQSMQEYYSDPEVIKTIEELRHKDVLYSFNQPEVYNQVMNAERKDNEKMAENSTSLDVLDYEEPEELEDTVLSLEAMKQAELINKQNEEREKLIRDAEEQARLIIAQNEYNDLIISAEEQAHLLQRQNELDEILLGAAEQAMMLKQQNDLIALKDGALEQAMMLQQKNDLIALKDGALEQAMMLKTLNDFIDKKEQQDKKSQEETEMLIKGAKEQARMLKAQNDREELKEEAKKQARMLKAKNDRIALKEGAVEQAKELVRKNTRAELKEGAKEQARMLKAKNDRIALKEGAVEQAKELVRKNARAELKEGAKEQARMLKAQNERAELKAGALEQAKELIEKNDSIYLKESAISQAKELMNDTKEAKELENIADVIVSQGSDKEEENKTDSYIDGAREQARLIYLQNERADMLKSAEEQAKMILSIRKEEAKKPNKAKVIPMIEPLYYDDRYCSIVAVSKPLRISRRQENCVASYYYGNNVKTTDRKSLLTSLKNDLESESLDFLRYSEPENVQRMVA